jgi:hypothetical protein
MWTMPRAGDVDRRTRSTSAGEVAQLADRTWFGGPGARVRLAAALARLKSRTQAAGYGVTTLCLSEAAELADADLLVKYGISAVREAAAKGEAAQRHAFAGWLLAIDGGRPRNPPLRTLRFGLWGLRPDVTLPGCSAGSAAKAIERAGSARRPCLIQVDANRLGGLRGPAWRALERVATLAARGRDNGDLQSVTVAQWTGRLAGARTVAPAHSILRPQAA